MILHNVILKNVKIVFIVNLNQLQFNNYLKIKHQN